MALTQSLSQNYSLQLSTSLSLDTGLDEVHYLVKLKERDLNSSGFLKDIEKLFYDANRRKNFHRGLPAENFLANNKKLFSRVLRFAASRHQGEYRDSGYPYLAHVISTGFVLARLGFPKEIIFSGLVHDAVEDTPDKLKTLNELYSILPEITWYVYSVSGPDIKDSVEKDKVLYKQIAAFSDKGGNQYPQAIKCADAIANLYDLNGMQPKDGRTAEQRKELFLNKLKTKVLPYASLLDEKNYIPISKKDEKFLLYEYLKELIEEKTGLLT